MRQTIPRVAMGRLYPSESTADAILVGTPAWYDWLEQHTVFLFGDLVGGFLARKSRIELDDLAWEASCTRHGKRTCVHLGPSQALTLQRLQAAALTLAGGHAPVESAEVGQAEAAASMPAVPTTAAIAGFPTSLIRTKYYRPRATSDRIPRVRLLERLNAGLSGKATLVCAPAGFGKTTLLVEWLQTCDRPTAWLSLDEDDNELAVFVHLLTAALQSVLPDALRATASLLNAPRFPSPDQVATLLSNDLADAPEDVIVVLDDYHLIHNNDVHRLLDLLMAHLPPHVHLVLAARSEPPLPIARWRAQGHLNELRSSDLRFTLAETHAFLTAVLGSEPELTREAAGVLQKRTEGWIAIVRLAALSLRGTSDPAAFLDQLRHSPEHVISQYLLEEVLDQLTPAVQELLIRTSILEQRCAELCVAVLGDETPCEHMQATLDGLERSNLFLASLDERQGWYRFHPLFREFLRQRLQERSSPEELATLHQRASAWYGEQGLIEEALQHALAAGNTSGAAQLVEGQFLWAFEQERWGTLERWLTLVPENQIQGSPSLLLARVWILQAHGQLTDLPRLLTVAERLLGTNGSCVQVLDDSQHRLLHALIAIAWSHIYYFTGQTQASLESARCAQKWLPPGEAYVASYTMQYLAWSDQATGQADVALVELQQALRELPARPNITARLLFAQAFVCLAASNLPQVEHSARYLLELAQEVGLALSHYFAHWLLGVVYYERNNLDTAVYHFSAVIANRHHAHFWVVQDAMCGLAFTYQVQGLGSQARETRDTLLEWVQEQHNMGELMTAYAFCGQLALLQDEGESAEQWLDMAGKQEVAGPMTFLEDPAITGAWMLLAKGDQVSVEHGQVLLTRLLQHVEAMHSTRKTIKVLALQAWAYDLQGRVTEALDVLERALALGRPAGFVRTFANLPKLSRLLHELHKRRKTRKALDSELDAYLQRLLVAMNPGAAHAVLTEELMKQEGLEPLTEREVHILYLLDKGLTNKEIARELVVMPGTVKVHTTNLYRKLSVNNRHAAVTLAKALGLLLAGKVPTPPLR